MNRDYAARHSFFDETRSAASSRAAAATPPPTKRWLWVLGSWGLGVTSTLAIGYVAMQGLIPGVSDLIGQAQTTVVSDDSQQESRPLDMSDYEGATPPEVSSEQKPRFDFYTLLPNMTLAPLEADEAVPTTRTQAINHKASLNTELLNATITRNMSTEPKQAAPSTPSPSQVAKEPTAPIKITKTAETPPSTDSLAKRSEQPLQAEKAAEKVIPKTYAYSVEVMRTAEQAEAITQLKGLRQQGYMAFLREIKQRKHSQYAVFMGPFKDKSIAERVLDTLKTEANLDGVIQQHALGPAKESTSTG